MKKIQTTNTNINVDLSTIMVVQIGDFSFEVDERFPWIEVYLTGGEHKKFVTEIDEEDMPTFVDYEKFKVYCLNWFFNNVEIVEEVTNEEEII